MTYREIMQQRSDDAILGALLAVNGNRRRAATLLKMSLRNFNYVIAEMKARGLAIPPTVDEQRQLRRQAA